MVSLHNHKYWIMIQIPDLILLPKWSTDIRRIIKPKMGKLMIGSLVLCIKDDRDKKHILPNF